MKFLIRYRGEIGVFICVALFFFASRLYALDFLPIFTDEAIYIRWAQIAKQDAAWRFISLTDGKQPLFVWLVAIAMRFIEDPLIAGRVVSVVAGFFSMIGLFLLGRELFQNRWVGLASSFLYVVFPMALVYDRMALYDGLVGTFAVWNLYLTVFLVRRLKLDVALILGMVIGGSVLTKTSGFFTIYLLPFSMLLLDLKKQGLVNRFIRWVLLIALAAGLGYGYYLILKLSPFFYIINEKNAIFVYSFKEWLLHPFRFLWGNLYVGEWNWLKIYLGAPLLVTIAVSFLIQKKYWREKLLLFLWFLLPFVSLALFGRVLYPRFIFFMTLSLLPLAALFSVEMVKKMPWYAYAICVAVVIMPLLQADYLILSDFEKAPIPVSDLGQYNNDWPAGGGVKEAVAFFEKESRRGNIFVATQGTFGLMPSAFEIYLHKNKNVTIRGFWPVIKNVPQELIEAGKTMPVYVVFYQPCDLCLITGTAPQSWPLDLIYQYKRPVGNSFLSLYKLAL